MQVSTYILFVVAHTLVRAVGVAQVPTPRLQGVATSPSPAPGSFGAYFKDLMAASGYENVHVLARAAGVSHANLGKWIANTANPTVESLRKIAPLLGVRLGDLMIRAGLATREELGTVGAPPPPGPPLTIAERTIRSRILDPRNDERYKRSFHAAILRAINDFDEVVADMADDIHEPRMRRRPRVS